MQTFNFEIHNRVITLQKDLYTIKASSLKEAKQKAIEIFKDEDLQFDELNGYIETETIFNTIENMSIEQNGGEATVKLIFGTETILDNSIKQIA